MIQVNHLQKYYGKQLAVEDVTFSVKEGEILGFVGPNGAGKSTTIRILLNFIYPSSGNATINGKDVVTESQEIKRFTGYVPSDVRYYEHMTVDELIRLNSNFHAGKTYIKEAERLCELFELNVTKKFGQLSTGNKKKVAIVCALASKPKVLILDEPTNGLDPLNQRRLFQELGDQASQGATILLSSHNLSEVQEYCDRAVFIKQGRILTEIDLKEIQKPRKLVTVVGGQQIRHPDMELLEHSNSKRIYRYHGDSNVLLALLQQAVPNDFIVENESLEARFMDLYAKEEQ